MFGMFGMFGMIGNSCDVDESPFLISLSDESSLVLELSENDPYLLYHTVDENLLYDG